ncbi:MAG: ATP-dependent Clp protease adaptor ClpS [Chloroflexi bacterium]|nr:ATP-dependent Clp protease adaptor ClpS [Chloroflexota bacterium]
MPQRWTEEEGNVATEQEARQKLDVPRLYKVLLHNDNYTTMDFVVLVLTSVFRKPEPEAVRIMLDVHYKGIGIVGTYPREVAETKVARVLQMAQEAQFPLLCTMEPE